MKKFPVFMSVAMFLLTTIAIICAFYLLSPTKLHLFFISTLSLLGYGGSICFYQEAKDDKSEQDYSLLLFGFLAYVVSMIVII